MKNIFLLCFIFSFTNLLAQKGTVRLKLGLPYFNHLVLKPSSNISINKIGFLGESIGLEYFYKDKIFLETNFSFVGVAKSPLPFPIDREGFYTTQYSSYFSLTQNHQNNKFTFGYGINYSINTWAEGFRSFEDPTLTTRTQITNRAIGLTLNSYFRLGKTFHIGLIYRPTFFRQNDNLAHQYEHLISLELLWRIRINKK